MKVLRLGGEDQDRLARLPQRLHELGAVTNRGREGCSPGAASRRSAGVLTISEAKTKIGSSACLKGSTNMAQSLTVAEKVLRLASALAAVKIKIGSRAYLKGSTNLAPSLTVAEKVLLFGAASLRSAGS